MWLQLSFPSSALKNVPFEQRFFFQIKPISQSYSQLYVLLVPAHSPLGFPRCIFPRGILA
jgi:hypothetical protein